MEAGDLGRWMKLKQRDLGATAEDETTLRSFNGFLGFGLFFFLVDGLVIRVSSELLRPSFRALLMARALSSR